MQMLNYSNASGVEYAGLTDGDHWELYEVFERGQLDDRRILGLSLSSMAAHECALRLLLLWRPNLESGKPVAAGEPVFSGSAWGEFMPECNGRCPASTILAELPSISFAGSPPRPGQCWLRPQQSHRAAVRHQSGSWGRQTRG